MRQLTLLLTAVVTFSACQAAPATATATSVPATAVPTKWEYREIDLWYNTLNDAEGRVSRLNELGEEGWEIIQVWVTDPYMGAYQPWTDPYGQYTQSHYLLKRPVPQN